MLNVSTYSIHFLGKSYQDDEFGYPQVYHSAHILTIYTHPGLYRWSGSRPMQEKKKSFQDQVMITSNSKL